MSRTQEDRTPDLDLPKAANDVEPDRSIQSDFADEAIDHLSLRIGERVRALRERKGLSRRVLCELSGVSPRYLVKLESGEGNTSIALLQRVAITLNQPIESLVAAADPLAAENNELIALYRQADAAARTRAFHALDPVRLQADKAARIGLIGLRGAGKSTLGPLLAEALELPFIELNNEIEGSAGMPLGEIIALYGDEGYRELEADTLQTIIAKYERVVLAVAGGLVDEQDSFIQILSRFHTVWISASPTEHMERVRAQGDLRPMAGNPQALTQLKTILKARESRYRRAEYHLDTAGQTLDVSRAELIRLVRASGIVNENTP